MNVYEDIKTGLEQAIEYENENHNYMSANNIAKLLVKLYGKYMSNKGKFEDGDSDEYAEAVGIAIRMLTD